MAEYEEIRAKVLADVRSCLVKDGKEEDICIDEAVERYNISESDRNKIARELGRKR